MFAGRHYDEFYLVWEGSCRNFIEDIKFTSPDAKSRLSVHVFLRNDTPVKALPPSDPDWITTHFTLTTSPYASDTGLIACLLEKYGDLVEESGDNQDTSLRRVFLVAERERQYEELIANLKLFNGKLDIQEINGLEMDIFEVVKDSCRFCRLVFACTEETDKHNFEQHNFFCQNPLCHGYRQRFPSEEVLLKHKASQTTCIHCQELFCSDDLKKAHMKHEHNINPHSYPPIEAKAGFFTEQEKGPSLPLRISCQFCPRKQFLTKDQLEIHMRNSHKKCNCSCGSYFKSREEYLDHFYSVYPLPCYENRKCPHRFQSVYYQAVHHRDFHNSLNPFYCVPCQKRKIEEGLALSTAKTSFKDDRSLRIHGCSLGHNETEMFLLDFDDAALNIGGETAPLRRSPTRTTSNLNYC